MNTPLGPHDAKDHNRMILAIALSLVILLGYHFIFEKPRLEALHQQKVAQEKAPPAAAVTPLPDVLLPRADVLAKDSKRIPIKGDKVVGTLSLKGARIDDLQLVGHYETLDKKDLVSLLVPAGAEGAFYFESGWVSESTADILPASDTQWSLAPGSARELTGDGAPVVLQWNNGHGLLFERSIRLDKEYLFEVSQKITNTSASPLKVNAYYLTARTGLPKEFKGFFVQHEGPISYLNGKLEEPQYKKILSGDDKLDLENASGWIGITDKYWMATILPNPKEAFNARIVGVQPESAKGQPHFQADLVSQPMTAAPGESIENATHFYTGVKTLSVINSYSEKFGFPRLDLSIDFGMWYFITKPFYLLFHFLVNWLGHIGTAILMMTVIVRIAMFPLASKAYTSMAKMKKVAPLLKELQEKYGTDKQKLQMEIFELYKRENANPFGGCWPMLVQIPIFFALYKVILISVEMRHAPFWGWIKDLSEPDPTSMFNLFGLIPWTPPSMLMIGIWPLLFCGTMIIQKRLSPPMADPVQEKIQTYFPYFITLMMAHFAAGLIIYWTWSNVLAILQQYYITRKISGEEVSLIHGHVERRKTKKTKTDA